MASHCRYERWAEFVEQSYDGLEQKVESYNEQRTSIPIQIGEPHIQHVGEHGEGTRLELDEYVLEVTDLPDEADVTDDVEAFAEYIRSELFVDEMKDAQGATNAYVKLQGYWEHNQEVAQFQGSDPQGALLTWDTEFLEELPLDIVDIVHYALKRAGVEIVDVVEDLPGELRDRLEDVADEVAEHAREVARGTRDRIDSILDKLDPIDDMPVVEQLIGVIENRVRDPIEEVVDGNIDAVRDRLENAREELEEKLEAVKKNLPDLVKRGAVERAISLAESVVDDLEELVDIEPVDTATDLAPKLIVRTLLGAKLGSLATAADLYSNLSVVCSETGEGYWVFAPIFTGLRGNLSHPIAGARKFGARRNDQGNLEFYTLGVSRMARYGQPTSQIPEFLPDYFWNQFHRMSTWIAEHIWVPLFNELRDAIREAGGEIREDSKEGPDVLHELRFAEFRRSCLTDKEQGIVAVGVAGEGFIGSEYGATRAMLLGTLDLVELSYDQVETTLEYRRRGEASSRLSVESNNLLFGREVTGLTPDTGYEFRFEAHWPGGDETVYSEWVSFRTEKSDDAEAGIEEVNAYGTSGFLSSEVGSMEASLTGEVRLQGLEFDEVSVQVVYRNGQETGSVAAETSSGSGLSVVQGEVTGLQSETTYEFRIEVTWEAEGVTETSEWVEFTTEAPEGDAGIGELHPWGSSGFLSSEIGATEAKLMGTVKLEQLDFDEVTCTVEYTDGDEVATEPASAEESGDLPVVVAEVTGLEPGTDYEFRIEVTWEEGGVTETSEWVSFVTDYDSPGAGGEELKLSIEGPDEIVFGYRTEYYAKINTDEEVEYVWNDNRSPSKVKVDDDGHFCEVVPVDEEVVGEQIDLYGTVKSQERDADVTEVVHDLPIVPESEAYLTIEGPDEIEVGETVQFGASVHPPHIAPGWHALDDSKQGAIDLDRGSPDTAEEAQRCEVTGEASGEVAVMVESVNYPLEATKTVTVIADRPPEILEFTGGDEIRVGGRVAIRATVAAEGEPSVDWTLTRDGKSVGSEVETTRSLEEAASGAVDGEVREATFEFAAEQPGEYEVRLEVTDGQGRSVSDSRGVTATRPEPPSVVSVVGPTRLNEEEAGEFVATLKAGADVETDWTLRRDGESVSSKIGNVGTLEAVDDETDGSTTYQQRIEVQSLEAGEHTIAIELTDEFGRSDSTSRTIEVAESSDAPPLGPVELEGPEGVVEGESAEFTATVTAGSRALFEWTVELNPTMTDGASGEWTQTAAYANDDEGAQTFEDTYEIDAAEPWEYELHVQVSDRAGKTSEAETSLSVSARAGGGKGNEETNGGFLDFFKSLFDH